MKNRKWNSFAFNLALSGNRVDETDDPFKIMNILDDLYDENAAVKLLEKEDPCFEIDFSPLGKDETGAYNFEISIILSKPKDYSEAYEIMKEIHLDNPIEGVHAEVSQYVNY